MRRASEPGQPRGVRDATETRKTDRRGKDTMKASPTGHGPLTRYIMGVLVSLLPAAPAATAAEPAPLELVQTIPLKGVEGRLDHLGIDTKGKRLFVANLSNNSLDVVDLDSGKLVKQVPG